MLSASRSIRRCSLCNKVGHNKARCRQLGVSTPPPSLRAPMLRLFVHHVNTNPLPSAHVVNLKNFSASEHNLPSVAPALAESSIYHTYHQLPTKKEDLATPRQLRPTVPIAKSRKTWSCFFGRLIFLCHPRVILNRLATQTKKIFTQISPTPRFSSLYSLFHRPARHRPTKTPIRVNFPKLALASVVALAIFSLPGTARSYYGNVTGTAETVVAEGLAGFTALLEALKHFTAGNMVESATANTNALEHLSTATNLVAHRHQILQSIVSSLPVVGDSFESGKRLLVAGESLSIANSYLLEAAARAASAKETTVIERLALMLEASASAAPLYHEAAKSLERVEIGLLPTNKQEDFGNMVQLLNHLAHDVNEIAQLKRPLNEIFGGNGLRRYLLIFQNPHELRATGGFMGSFAVLDVKNGAIVRLDIPPGGSYDLQGQLDAYVEPPLPLTLANKRWEFQDANWFPHFPTSAEKIMWFYRHSRGITLDGVIAINASVLERLLTLLGPLTDTNRQLTLSAATAVQILEQTVETGVEKKQNRPKQIITDLAPHIIEKLKQLPPAGLIPLATNLATALTQKEIQMYFTDPAAETTLQSFGWAGALIPTRPPQDYLLVVNSNIQGSKSDAAIRQNISHQAVINEQGDITDTVTITREHDGGAQTKFSSQTNIDYIRVYVPAGSILVAASGFSWPDEKLFRAPEPWYKPDETLVQIENEVAVDARSGTRVTAEFGKYAFGNWIITEPGTASQIQFTYRLPFKAWNEKIERTTAWNKIIPKPTPPARYQLVAQRQSGALSDLESQIIIPENWKLAWYEGDGLRRARNGVQITKAPLTHDMVWSLIIEKNTL